MGSEGEESLDSLDRLLEETPEVKPKHEIKEYSKGRGRSESTNPFLSPEPKYAGSESDETSVTSPIAEYMYEVEQIFKMVAHRDGDDMISKDELVVACDGDLDGIFEKLDSDVDGDVAYEACSITLTLLSDPNPTF